MKKNSCLFLCVFLLGFQANAQNSTLNKTEFTKVVQAYQSLAVKDYIQSGALMGTDEPDTTSVESLIKNTEIEEDGSFVPEKTATFILGWMPYQEKVTMVQWIRKDGKKILGITHQLNTENIESNGMQFESFKILDDKFNHIKNKVLPSMTLNTWNQAHQKAIQQGCDNYTTQNIPALDDETTQGFYLVLGRGGSKASASTWFIVESRFQVRNTICKLYIGALKFNPEKGILEFYAY